MSAHLRWAAVSNLYSGNNYRSMVESVYRQRMYRLEVWWSYDSAGRAVGRATLFTVGMYIEPVEHWNNVIFERTPLLEAQEWAEDQMLTPMDRLTIGLIS